MFWFLSSLFAFVFAYYGQESVSRDMHMRVLSRVCLVLLLGYVIGFGGKNYVDHAHYIEMYRYVGVHDMNFFSLAEKVEGAEVGFWLLMKTLNILGINYVGFFFLVSILTNGLIVNAFYRYRYPVLALMLYMVSSIFGIQCNLVRQMLAVAIVFYILKYLEERDWLKYIIGLIIASSIHRTAFLMIIFLPLCFVKEKVFKLLRYVLLALWLSSLLVYFGLLKIDISRYFFTFFVSDYNAYFSDMDFTRSGEQEFNVFYHFAILLWLVFLYKNDKRDILGIIVVIGGVLMNFVNEIPAVVRMSYYCSIVGYVFIPELFYNNMTKLRKYYNMFIYIYILRTALTYANYILVKNFLFVEGRYDFFDLFRM